jgi:predicted choloylglycine hydrolase
MTTRQSELDFRFVDEPVPGAVWGGLFGEFWPAFRRWYYKPSAGGGTRPDYATCERMLRRHLPSMVPVCRALTGLAGGGDDVARFLTLYCPPPSIRGCTQAVWKRDGELALVRNYDFAPKLCDGVALRSAWSGVGVIAMTDCLVGALDGMNEHGLAASLAFGGDRVVGAGFGTTMLVRAALESCSTVAEAVSLLGGVPVHMAYSVTLVDRRGAHATVHLHPQRAAQITASTVATNHQERVVWPEHAGFTRSLERRRHVESMLDDDSIDVRAFTERFLEPPLHRREYARGSGTLYTAVYSPVSGTLDLYWPGAHRRVGFGSFPVGTHVARYGGRSAVSGG